jgi:DNA-binding MarR family transcriptional regulator
MYLLYLVYFQDQLNINYFKDMAEMLNISASTLSRNIQKLEQKELLFIENVPGTANRILRLKSKGQLIVIEIKKYLKDFYK